MPGAHGGTRQKRSKKDCRLNWSSNISKRRIAVVGGGLSGLTAAIRLAENGFQVELFEAAAKLGGRTRSFVDKTTGELCDNGPHLLIGAYEATQKLMHDCNASHNITWQPSLKLPLWDEQRHHFALSPASWLPFSIALMLAVRKLPGHGWGSAAAMLRLAIAINAKKHTDTTVSDLIHRINIPIELVQDMIEPLCLGVMNEAMQSADASTFKRVLKESFASKMSARLGWFNAPLDQALIEPLIKQAKQLAVNIRSGCRVRSVKSEAYDVFVDGEHFDAAIIALPAYAADNLFDRDGTCETRCITNVHLWYKGHPGLAEPLVGGIGTTGQWFFDVSAQMQHANSSSRHLCAVISADQSNTEDNALVDQINRELNLVCESNLSPYHYRIIREKRATVLVRARQHAELASMRMIDATETPTPGELPATIEFAVQRGEKAALEVTKLLA